MGGGGGQEDGRIKGIKKKGERGHVCKIFFLFFYYFYRFTRRKHILDREFLYRCACRKETASRELVVVMVKMREVGMLL